MAGYRMTDDITFYSEGTVQSGWVSLRDRYEKKYRAGGQSMGTLTFSDLTIDVLASDSAMARGRWKVDWQDRSASGLFTILLRKLPEGWKVVHDHTSAAPAEKN
jgi:beta-aspartyl-peptidase (threonine type)